MSDVSWYKNNDSDRIWWRENPDRIGEWVFSFDRITEYNMFSDYPYKLTPEQREIFNKEYPEWAEFFRDRM